MGSFKTTLGYLCFGLIMVAVFLYALFPDQAIRDYLESRLAAVDPSLAITAEGIRPAIPPGVKMHGVSLSRNGVRMASFDNARLSMDLATLLKAQKRFQFEAQVADGSINGLGVMEGTGPAARLRTEADLEAVRLEALEGIQSLPNVSLAGPVNGRLTHEGALAPAGKVDGLLTAPGLRISLANAFFGINEVTMDQTEADFSISGETLRLKSLSFAGPLLEGRINGTVQLENPFVRSRLNLTGNVKPRPELFARLQGSIPQGIVNPRTLGTRGVNFRIYGTVEKPDMSMR